MAFGDYASNGTTADSASSTTHNLTFPGSTTTGNTVIVIARVGANTTVAGSDSKGNSYALDQSVFQATDGHKLCVLRASNITGGSSHQVTLTLGTSAACRWIIDEYGGNFALHGTPPTATGNGTGPSSGNQTTSATCALIGAIGVAGDFNDGTYTAGSGWTKRRTVIAGGRLKVVNEDRAGTVASGTYTANGTINTAENWSAILAAYSDGGGGGGTTVKPLTQLGVG